MRDERKADWQKMRRAMAKYRRLHKGDPKLLEKLYGINSNREPDRQSGMREQAQKGSHHGIW